MKNVVAFVLLFASATAFVAPDTPKFLGGRVWNGQNAVPHVAPYMVLLAIVSPETGEMQNCGAVILNSRWVLTAAHCLLDADSIVLIAGQHDVSTVEPWEQRRFVERSYIHEDFCGNSVGVCPNNIGLIYVNQPFTFDQYVQPIMLPGFQQIPTGIGRIFGWGLGSVVILDNLEQVLQVADIPIFDAAFCFQAWGPLIGVTDLCAGPDDGSIAACPEDSGGPLVQFDVDGEPIVVGISSWGATPCGWPATGVYVRVSAFVDWIYRTVGLIDVEIN